MTIMIVVCMASSSRSNILITVIIQMKWHSGTSFMTSKVLMLLIPIAAAALVGVNVIAVAIIICTSICDRIITIISIMIHGVLKFPILVIACWI